MNIGYVILRTWNEKDAQHWFAHLRNPHDSLTSLTVEVSLDVFTHLPGDERTDQPDEIGHEHPTGKLTGGKPHPPEGTPRQQLQKYNDAFQTRQSGRRDRAEQANIRSNRPQERANNQCQNRVNKDFHR